MKEHDPMKKSVVTKVISVLAALLLLALPTLSLAEDEIVLGVTGGFYEDLWQPAIDALKAEGINVKLQQFSDFSLPNNALNGGEIQVNAFQHHAYFNNDTATNGYDLTVIADTFIITMNLFSSRYDSLEALAADADAGKELTVIVPNDATNYGRALILLRDAGLLELSEYEGTPNVENIVSQKVQLTEVNASMTYQYLDDASVAASVINGNYAASYGVDPATAIYHENVDLNNESFICVIAVRTQDKDNETYRRIAEVFRSDVTTQVVREKFDGFFYLTWEE
jgi:D-methionine transport system substrate-binding protein